MKEFETYASTTFKARVASHAISKIIWSEITRHFGEDVYVEDGYIKTRDYRHRRKEKIVREASDYEIELYDALKRTANYFSNL